MEVNNSLSGNKDGDSMRPPLIEAPSVVEMQKPNHEVEGNVKKKRRRGKSKRKLLKPFAKAPWQDRRKNDKSKRNNRFRKIVLTKTRAPFNNNQFLMEIHKPEPEDNFHKLQTPSARTRDSSFSVDSEENYFFSLPEDEEEYLTKEFSSVYEDAQSERLSNMSKNELIQEYLLLEAKYDNLVKRTDRSKPKYATDNDRDMVTADRETSMTGKDDMITEKDISGTSIGSGVSDEPSISDIMQRLKEQDEQIQQLKLTNEKLQFENERLRGRSQGSSSEDSESDSSSTSASCSSSSPITSPVSNPTVDTMEVLPNGNQGLDENGVLPETELINPLVNGFHSPEN